MNMGCTFAILKKIGSSCLFRLIWESILNFSLSYTLTITHAWWQACWVYIIWFTSLLRYSIHIIQTEYTNCKSQCFSCWTQGTYQYSWFFSLRLLSLLKSNLWDSWSMAVYHLKIHYDPQRRHNIMFSFYSTGNIWKACTYSR